MPQKIINDAGDEVEVFTQAELEDQKSLAIEEFKETELNKVVEERDKIQKELEGLKDKDINFSALRSKLSEKDKEIDSIKKEIDTKIGSAKKEVLDAVMKDYYDDTIKRLAGDDKELQDKIELQYKRLSDAAGTKDEISKKLNDAFVLAAGKREGFNSSAFSSGGVGNIGNAIKGTKKLNSEERELLDKLAGAGGMKIEDKDIK